MFFYDQYGGSFFAVAIKPESLRVHRDLSLKNTTATSIVDTQQKVPTKDEILEELATISGDGLVEGLLKDRFVQ